MATFPRAGTVTLLVILMVAASLFACDGDSEPSQVSRPSSSQSPQTSQAVSSPRTTLSSEAGGATADTSGAQFTRANWGMLASDPEAHKGASVDIVGRLIQDPVRRDDGAFWQMYADPKNYEWNARVHYFDPSILLAADDFVHVTGTVRGALEGENTFGESVTLVDVLAETAEEVDVMAAASPAERVALVDGSLDQNGLVITLEKVEFAADETRVFLEVANGSVGTASLYDLQLATATQSGIMYDAVTLWDYYPSVEWELASGMESSGIVVFPPLNASQPVEIRMETDLEDYTLDLEPYVFDVPVDEGAE